MNFDIVSVFPNMFDSYFGESMLKKARDRGLVSIATHDLKEYSDDKKHHTVDDRPFGGGPGMVLKVQPVYEAVRAAFAHRSGGDKAKRGRAQESRDILQKPKRTRIILFSAKGKQFTQKDARRYQRYYDNLVMICGRYEGVDERVAKYIADEEVSVGPYVLTGGEVPAMVVVDAVSRLVSGVLGKEESIEEKRDISSQAKDTKMEIKNPRVASYPVYTRPEVFEPKPGVKWRVPKVLLSGNHKKIDEWREEHMQ